MLLLTPQMSWAAGTAAGTLISNSATLSYATSTFLPATATSNVASFLVDQKINLLVVEVTGSATFVGAGQARAVTTFLVTNLGNAPQGFNLTAALALANPAGAPPFSTNDFSATGLVAYADTNNNGIYDPLIDIATSITTLAADASQKVFVVSDIPTTVLSNQQSVVSLTATATAPATMTALVATLGSDTAAVDFVFSDAAGVASGDIARDAKHSAYAAYLNSGAGLTLIKSVVSVLDPMGSATLMPSAVMTYQIVATLAGTGTANNIVITDPLPANITYLPGSIIVDNIAKTDAADADNAQFITASQTLVISLGNVAPPANFVITFRATIN
ncbi:MAG: hypothetical protein PHI11_14910 [Gallionella sp.]|nr:hypothetical protein [Gallionella sp.]